MKDVSQVYYDGSCSLCSAAIGKVAESTEGAQFSMKDIEKEVLPEGLTPEGVRKEIHVIDGEGRVHKNVDGLLMIAAAYPRYALLVWLGRLPVIKQLLRALYFLFARDRHFWSRIFLPKG